LTAITQHCWIQISDPTPRHYHELAAPIPEAHCDFRSVTNLVPGPAVTAEPACVVSFRASPWSDVYLCTWWEFDHAGQHEDWYWDYEWSSDGDAGKPVRVTSYPADTPPGDPLSCSIALS
jgi:hypothetical protein